ncbi:MAG: hypothetical protein OXD01_01660, partial [Gammaproteobacteria bacterium]|nr:hypothetical protein [Gammaproteobacteria bacterium]
MFEVLSHFWQAGIFSYSQNQRLSFFSFSAQLQSISSVLRSDLETPFLAAYNTLVSTLTVTVSGIVFGFGKVIY